MDMQLLRRWVLWRWELRPDKKSGTLKWTKPPYRPGQPWRHASSTDARTWGTFPQAVAAYRHRDADGIGFVLGDDWTGVDLDHVVDLETGAFAAWALEEVALLGSYSERSPSGTGIHILVHGILEMGDGRDGRRRGDLEVYSAGRYFTVTGLRMPGTMETVESRQEALDAVCARYFPPTPDPRQQLQKPEWPAGAPPHEQPPITLSDDALIARAKSARHGAKFRALWEGDTSGYESPSEAVAALLHALAFWTGNDHERMDRLFRRSALFTAKWDDKRGDSTWGAQEIERVKARTTDIYTPARRTHLRAPRWFVAASEVQA
jgi:primase-polymerase (primpol)-like protein